MEITVKYIDGSSYTYRSFDQIINCDNVIELNCRYNKLTELPRTIDKLTNLQKLYCGYNQLIELPQTIGNLTNLQNLYCYNDQLTELPQTIGDLTNLRSVLWTTPTLRSGSSVAFILLYILFFILQFCKIKATKEPKRSVGVVHRTERRINTTTN